MYQIKHREKNLKISMVGLIENLNKKLEPVSNELKLVYIVDFPKLRAVFKILGRLTPELVEKLLKLGLTVREVKRGLNESLKEEVLIGVDVLAE